jgi:16S rRNA A1518/A1519 N6-dimethyltransferase RsmA/KsgA/DIM1 with predicted DNA glycosylase/AP lyase activity
LRGQNIEYINFIKRSLEITKIAEQKPRENLSILELGCGSGPLGAEMIDQVKRYLRKWMIFSNGYSLFVDHLSP